MLKNRRFIIVMLVLFFTLVGFAAAGCKEGKVMAKVGEEDKCVPKTIAEFVESDKCPGCQIKSEGPPPTIALSESGIAKLPDDFEGDIIMGEGKSFTFNGKKYGGKGECTVNGKIKVATCFFTGDGEYMGDSIKITSGEVNLYSSVTNQIEISCTNFEKGCNIDFRGVRFNSFYDEEFEEYRPIEAVIQLGELRPLQEKRFQSMWIRATEGTMELPEGFFGTAICTGNCEWVDLANGDRVIGGHATEIKKEIFDRHYAFTPKAEIITSAGETVKFSGEFVDTFLYYPREFTGVLPDKCMSGDRNCIRVGKQTILTGENVEFIMPSPPKPLEVANLLFRPLSTGRCVPKEEENCLKATGPLISRQPPVIQSMYAGDYDYISLPKGTELREVEISDETLQGIEVIAVCTDDGCTTRRLYEIMPMEILSFKEEDTNSNSQATSFFNFIGKAWSWITGKQTAKRRTYAGRIIFNDEVSSSTTSAIEYASKRP